jgi:hypothetical protein
MLHVIEDIAAWDASLKDQLMNDLVKIDRIVRTRGLRLLLSDFPKLGKALDRSLSACELLLPDDNQVTVSRGKKKSPRWFSSLFDRIFDTNMTTGWPSNNTCCILWNVDPTAVSFLRQLLYMYKKLVVPCPTDAVLRTAEEFFTIDMELREPWLPWDQDPTFFEGALGNIRNQLSFSRLLEVESKLDMLPSNMANTATLRKAMYYLDCVVQRVWSNSSELDPDTIVPKHGPGSVADLSNREDKYTLPVWSKKLDHYFPETLFAYSSEEWANISAASRSRNEGCARLLQVPKTFDKPRLITAEPTAHQYLQQGLLRWIRDNLPYPLRCCIDFRSQEPSRVLALRSSSDGMCATVDLSMASDRLSTSTVERVFARSPILPYLYATRTIYVQNAVDKSVEGDPPQIIRKFAGQGSAVTFPVQSIVYACCSIAACLLEKGLAPNNRNIVRVAKGIQVFGDDIIIPKEALAGLALILSFLQLKINVSKTHYEGPFRESCGMDAFRGTDVTPCYLRHLEPGSAGDKLTSWIDVCNNAWSSGLWNLSKYMENVLTSGQKRHIPVCSAPLAGLTLRTFCEGYKPHGCTRYNKALHRNEVRGLVPRPKQLLSQRGGDRALLQFFTEVSFRSTYEPFQGIPSPWKEGYSIGTRFNLKRSWVPVYF